MRKLWTALLILCMTAVYVPTLAAEPDILIEAENYASASFKVPVETIKEFSGGSGIAMLANPIAGNAYKINYNFNANKAGAYQLSLRCGDVGQLWTTDFWLSINDSEPVYISDVAVKTADFRSETCGVDLIKEYTAGAFEVEEGRNVLSVIIDSNDVRSAVDGKIGFWLDYVSLSEVGFGFNKMTSAGVNGVYQKGERVSYTLSFYSKAEKEYKYTYRVTDFWGREAENGELTLAQGKKTMKLNLGMYDVGWYKTELFENGESISSAHFSVVPKASERYKGETPFAVDLASYFFAKDEKELNRQIKTAQLAGITYVRERGGWSAFGKGGQQDWASTVTGNMPKLKEAGFGTTQILETTNLFQNGVDSFKDLFAAYDFQKRLVENADGIIDVIEIDNELDGATSKIMADDYSAYLKAMFISNADTGGKMKMSVVSQCLDVDQTFNEGLRLNEAMEYTDLYNFHAHTTFGDKDKTLGIREDYVEKNLEAKMKSSDKDMPFWLTEAGIYIILEDGRKELTDKQAKDQARYLTTATVESLAGGVDKIFWFIWPKYIENNQEMGTFDANGNPNPAYQAEAICSYMLGKGKYIGTVEDGSVKGHLFDNGTNDVMVLWTDAPQSYEIKTDTPVTVTDMMGQKSTLNPTDGKVSVETAYYPIYVTFDGKADTANYYPREYKVNDELKREFTAAERIILQQTFEGKSTEEARSNGYELANGETEQLTLTVNNFNKQEKIVELKGVLDGYDVDIETDTVKVPAMSKVDVKVKLVPTEESVFPDIGDIRKNLKFTAETDGAVSSPSVTPIRIVNENIITPMFLMEGSENIENFDISNVADGAETNATVQADGSYRFGVTFAHTNCWYYPKLKVNDPEKLADTDGIVFYVQSDKIEQGIGDIKSFIDFKDGRRYYTGMARKYPCEPGWVQAKIAWDDFILFTSPYGAMDLRDFDPTLIEYIEIGGHFYNIDLSQEQAYYIKEPGFFAYSDTSGGENTKAVFEIEQNGIYSAAQLGTTKVVLPDDAQSVSVMLTDEYTDKFTKDGNEINVDLSSLSRGKYSLRVITKDKDGFAKSGKVDFYIE